MKEKLAVGRCQLETATRLSFCPREVGLLRLSQESFRGRERTAHVSQPAEIWSSCAGSFVGRDVFQTLRSHPCGDEDRREGREKRAVVTV